LTKIPEFAIMAFKSYYAMDEGQSKNKKEYREKPFSF